MLENIKLKEKMGRNEWTLALGMFLNISLIGLFFLIAHGLSWPYIIGGWCLIVWYFWYLPMITIPIGHKGVPIFLGARQEGFYLNEGRNWILPPPFMSYQAVDVREDVLPVKDFECFTHDKILVHVDAAIYFRINDPFKALSVQEHIINEGLIELVETVLRSSISTKDSEDILTAYQQTLNGMRDDLQIAADQKADEWGIDVRNVKVPNIKFSKELIQELEKMKREQAQKAGEEVELNFVRKQIKQMSRDTGLKPKEAREVVLAERGKLPLTKNIQEHEFNVSSELADVLAHIAELFGKKSSSKRGGSGGGTS